MSACALPYVVVGYAVLRQSDDKAVAAGLRMSLMPWKLVSYTQYIIPTRNRSPSKP